jgi:hypothetical protein
VTAGEGDGDGDGDGEGEVGTPGRGGRAPGAIEGWGLVPAAFGPAPGIGGTAPGAVPGLPADGSGPCSFGGLMADGPPGGTAGCPSGGSEAGYLSSSAVG